MRFLVAALAALLLAVPAAAEAQSTISMPGVGAALTVSTGANGGGVRVTGGGYYNGQDYFSITRAPNFPADAIGDFTKGKPCESGGTGVVNCIAPPASVTFTGGTGADTVYIGSTPGGGVNVTSILTGGGNDTVRVGGNGSRGPIDGGEGVDMIAPHFTYLASGGGWTIDLAAGTVTSNGAPGTSYSATNFEWVDLDTSLGAPGGTHTVYGTDGPNTIYGGRSGLQTISGRGGDDRLVAGPFDKAVIDGGAGNDTISGGGLDDVLTGGIGADKFNCGAGVDLVTDFNPAEGDTITADCEQVLPAEFDITRVGRGEYTFHSRIVADPAVQPLRLSWEYGNGKTEGDFTIGRTTYDKPGTYSVVHRALDINNTPYRKTKTLEIPAPELAVGVSIDEAALSGGRLPLDTWVNAKVRVASTGDDGVGDLSNLKFTDAVLKAGGTAQVELELPAAPAAFSLAPGTHRDFDVRVKALTRGDVAFNSTVTGKDAAGKDVSKTGSAPIRAGLDLEVIVTAAPKELDLEVDSAATPPRPIKQPVTLTVRVRNVSGQPARNLTLNVDPAIRDSTGYNPAAPFPLTVRGTSTGVPVRDLANGEATDVVFTADAANKAVVDVRAVARGTAIASGSLPVREIAGNGTTDVRIGQPKLIALTADGPAYAGVVKAGGRWTYSGHVENLSPNRAITVFVFAKRSQNVVDGQLSSIFEPGGCTCGVYKKLEPGREDPGPRLARLQPRRRLPGGHRHRDRRHRPRARGRRQADPERDRRRARRRPPRGQHRPHPAGQRPVLAERGGLADDRQRRAGVQRAGAGRVRHAGGGDGVRPDLHRDAEVALPAAGDRDHPRGGAGGRRAHAQRDRVHAPGDGRAVRRGGARRLRPGAHHRHGQDQPGLGRRDLAGDGADHRHAARHARAGPRARGRDARPRRVQAAQVRRQVGDAAQGGHAR